jgi:hypothetical protein
LGKTDTTIITTSNPGYTPYQLFSTNGKVYAVLQQVNNNKIRILQSADTGATWSYHSTISSCKNTKGMVLVNNKLYAANDYRGVYTTNVTDTVWTKANKNLNGYPVQSLAVSDNAMAVATTGEEIMYLAPDFKQWKIAYPSAFFYNHKKIYLIHDSLYNVTTSFIRRWDNTRNEWETIAGDGYITASCLYKVLEFYFLPVCKSNGYGRTLDVTTGEYDERFEKKPEGKYVTDMTEGDWSLYGTLNDGGIILLGPSSLSALTIVNTPPIKKIVFAGGYLFGIPTLATGTFMRVPITFDSTTQVDYLTSNLPEQGWVDVYIDDNETIFLLNKNGKIYYSVNQGTDWTIANTSGLPADEYTSLNKRNDTLFIGTKSNYILYNTMSSVLSDKKIKPKQFNVNIFPNPFSNEFRVTCDKPFDSISVHDMYGKDVYSTTVPSTELSINLSASPKGVYFVKIISDNNMVKTIKLIRE